MVAETMAVDMTVAETMAVDTMESSMRTVIMDVIEVCGHLTSNVTPINLTTYIDDRARPDDWGQGYNRNHGYYGGAGTYPGVERE
jgi:hypothetical protein